MWRMEAHSHMSTGNVTIKQNPPPPKPFYKSKGFWGSVLSAASIFAPAPVRPLVTLAGSALGLYGRATAQAPLDFGGQK